MRERLVGAAVLVAVVVLVVPALLTGVRRPTAADAGSPAPEHRSVEIWLDPAAAPAPAAETGAQAEPAAEPATAAPAPPESSAHAVPDRDTTAAPAPPKEAQARPEAVSPTSPAAPASPPQRGAAASGWAVQLGAFSSLETAQRLAGELRRRGHPVLIAAHEARGRELHRVRVGPVDTREAALALSGKLRAEGHQAVVVPHP